MHSDSAPRLAEWALRSAATGVAQINGDTIELANARFQKFASGVGTWRWLTGPHASTAYASLNELVVAEVRAMRAPCTVSRFECCGRVLELRAERIGQGAVVLAIDVTEELRAQNERQRERETLLHEERMQAMGVLASSVAHDINHALNVIALRMATLRADPQFASANRTLTAVEKMVGDAARIVARLQDLARRRRDRPSEPVDLSAVLTGAVEMARTEADLAGVRIEARVPPLSLVRGSAAELSHVFMSLLARSRGETRSGGSVHVLARQEDSKVIVTIEDEGQGMREHELARLFDPFAGGRRDLGLSIAYAVMARLGGSISAHSRPSAGTVFTLSFPLAAAPKHVQRRVTALPRRHRVLLVDDEADNLEVLREVLELEGQDVETAQSGPIALARMERGERFDLVLCDVGMPEMSGWEVAREIHERTPDTEVFMLTGWANEIGATDVRRRLVRGVLAKPLDLDALRRLLSSTPRQHEPAAVTH